MNGCMSVSILLLLDIIYENAGFIVKNAWYTTIARKKLAMLIYSG